MVDAQKMFPLFPKYSDYIQPQGKKKKTEKETDSN